MRRRDLMLGGLGLMGGCGALGPPATGAATATAAVDPVTPAEHAHTIALMRPPKRARPLVAILADNVGAETTDLLIPYSVLTRSGLVQALVVAPSLDPIQLMPALRIRPQASLAAFDAAHPDGPDYVIVPAQHRSHNPSLSDWLRRQAAGGATIIGVCAGAKVLGEAGLLDHRQATSHWAEIGGLRRAHPTMVWRRDRRYVAERGLVTTTGVTASLPLSLGLVEAIGGPQRSAALAQALGEGQTDERHDSAAFHLTGAMAAVALENGAAVFGHETVGLPVTDWTDELSLAFTADAWSRTFRSRVLTVSDRTEARTRHGLTLLPDRRPGETRFDLVLPEDPPGPSAASLDLALRRIAVRYGRPTAAFVALQLEYSWPARAD